MNEKGRWIGRGDDAAPSLWPEEILTLRYQGLDIHRRAPGSYVARAGDQRWILPRYVKGARFRVRAVLGTYGMIHLETYAADSRTANSVWLGGEHRRPRPQGRGRDHGWRRARRRVRHLMNRRGGVEAEHEKG